MSWLLAENFESVGSKRHESIEHSCKQVLNLHTLLNHDGDANRVDTTLDQAHLLITLGDEDGLHEE